MNNKTKTRTLCVLFKDPSGGLHATDIQWGNGKIDMEKINKIVSLHSCLKSINILAVISK